MVRLPAVVGHADPVVLRDHVRVDCQGALDRVEPGHLVVTQVAHGAGEEDLVAHTDRVVHQLGVAEAGRGRGGAVVTFKELRGNEDNDVILLGRRYYGPSLSPPTFLGGKEAKKVGGK